MSWISGAYDVIIHGPYLKRTQLLCVIWWHRLWAANLYPGSRRAGKERAWYTLFAHAFNLPKIWGLRGIFWFFRVMWRQRSDSIMYTYQDITMACNESSDCSTATDLLNFVRSIITVSKLCLHFAHLRFSKPSSSFNVISYRALILDASLSWLDFLPTDATLFFFFFFFFL